MKHIKNSFAPGDQTAFRPSLTNGKPVHVVIAAYNEAATIQKVVTALKASYDHIIVVNDGSVDDTAVLARQAGATVLSHVTNFGQGAALQTGIDFACRAGAEFVATFDADGQHTAQDIATLMEKLEESNADIALGSRFLGCSDALSLQRRCALKGAIFMTWLFTGLRFSDAHNGLRVMNRRAASVINMRQNRMAHASEIVGLIKRHRLRYVEAPMTLTYTAYSIEKGQRTWSGAFAIVADLAWGLLHR